MPFYNFDEVDFNVETAKADITIIGAGAAGICLGVELSRKGKNVLIIESGNWTKDENRQILNEVEQAGKELNCAKDGRIRAIGGTTLAWGGQSLPFSAFDFEEKKWVENSGWPLPYADVFAYYKRANHFMGVDDLDYSGDIFALLKKKPLKFDNTLINYHFSKWAPQPNFKVLYEQELNKSATILYNAVVTKINLDENGNAEFVEVSNFKGRKISLKVERLIIAAGGIETNRLLLSNNQQAKEGLGNKNGWLGKAFMDHPCVDVGIIKPVNKVNIQSNFNTHLVRGRKYSFRLSLAEKIQHEKQLINASGSIIFGYPRDVFDPYAEIRRTLRRRQVSFKQLVKSSRSYMLTGWYLLTKKTIYKDNAVARFAIMAEQEPITSSSISLSKQTDMFGIPKAQLHWDISEKTWKSICTLATACKAELARLNMGYLELYSDITEDNTQWKSLLSDVNHHMGGTRMSQDASSGIVNKDLQMWQHPNIYVCSSSVFPTGSHSNPTLTLLALAMRLSDQLSENLAS